MGCKKKKKKTSLNFALSSVKSSRTGKLSMREEKTLQGHHQDIGDNSKGHQILGDWKKGLNGATMEVLAHLISGNNLPSKHCVPILYQWDKTTLGRRSAEGPGRFGNVIF